MSSDRTTPSRRKIGSNTLAVSLHRETVKGLTRSSGQCVKRLGFTCIIHDLVEECAKLRAGELHRGIRHDLYQPVKVEFGGEHISGAVQQLEAACLFADLLGCLAPDACELQVRTNARQQFARGKRLNQIVVRTCIETLDLRLLAGASGQQDDGYIPQLRIGPQRRHQAEPIQPRHHHITQQQIGTLFTNRAQCSLAIGRRHGHRIGFPAGA